MLLKFCHVSKWKGKVKPVFQECTLESNVVSVILEHLNWIAPIWKISCYFPKLLHVLCHFRQHLLFQIFKFTLFSIYLLLERHCHLESSCSYKSRIKRLSSLSKWAKEEFIAYGLIWQKSNFDASYNTWMRL